MAKKLEKTMKTIKHNDVDADISAQDPPFYAARFINKISSKIFWIFYLMLIVKIKKICN